MGEVSPAPKRTLSFGLTVAKFAAAWGFLLWVGDTGARLYPVDRFMQDVIASVFAGFPTAARHVEAGYTELVLVFGWALTVTLFFGTGAAVLGALARMVARARVRAGQADFLDRLRAWTAAHPKRTRALLFVPGALWLGFLLITGSWDYPHFNEWLSAFARSAIPMAISAWAITSFTKKGVRELLAPTMDGADAETRFEIDPDEIAFDAVAVTRRTVGLVAAFAAMMIAIPFLIAKLPILELFRHGELDLYLFGGYAAFAAVGAYAFRRASRVAVGVDGVHVHGTAREQFFAYRDLEAVRVNGSDLELVRRGTVVLRLQLHGADATRRDAVRARITENIVRVGEGRGAVAAQIVATSSREALARLAEGAGDYRVATLSREQLWALVEGPEIDASARQAAAEALVRTSREDERVRLRVAAEHCAEPEVRLALEALATGGEERGEERRQLARGAE